MSYKDIYELYGLREDYDYGYGDNPGTSQDICDLIATFDSREYAEAYVRKSELKNPQHRFGHRLQFGRYRFRATSLLRSYAGYDIKLQVKSSEPEHNPKL